MPRASSFACSTGARVLRCAVRAPRLIASSMPRPCRRPSPRLPISPLSTARRPTSSSPTTTSAATHDVIRANVHRSPMYSGQIKSTGPRYCPSIEDKIVRFGDRDGHQIFLEQEGLDDTTVYPNGISTSLPEEVQLAILASIPGLGRVRMVRPGYAIEYDHVDPRELDPTLQTKRLPGLSVAGQSS